MPRRIFSRSVGGRRICRRLCIVAAVFCLGSTVACSDDDGGAAGGASGSAGSAAGRGGTGAGGSGASSTGGSSAGGSSTGGSSTGGSSTGGSSTGGGSTGGSSGTSSSGGSGGSDPDAGGGGDSGAALDRSACKRGIAYGHHSKADLAALSPAVTWWYNWAYVPDDALRDGSYRDAGVEYVPMVWGGSFNVSTMTSDIPAGARALLGFNEPNFGSQANLTASQAAALWPQVEQIADARNLLLVSPAVNFCGGDCRETDPFKYLDDFLAACSGCRVDRIAFHIYVGCNQNGANKAQWLINHVETYKQRFSKPLWLTEFACTDAANFTEQIAFLQDAVEYLENEPRIERYSWFSGRFNGIPYVNLLGGDGQLTPLGEAYVAAAADPDCPR